MKEIVSEGGYDLYGSGSAIDIASLPPKIARDLEKYVKSKPMLKGKPAVKKATMKKPLNITKTDLAPNSLAMSKINLTNNISRDSKPVQGHLPIFGNSTPSYVQNVGNEIPHHSDDQSNSSSFYSDSDEN